MDKNKYRGLTLDTKKWVYGWYATVIGYHYIIPDNADIAGISPPNLYGIINSVEVIPETVGQFTGLLDENGKEEVYANDIVSGNIRNDSGLFRGIVVWSDSLFCWTVRATSGHEIDLCGLHHIEKIGNAFDNPELIEETK